MKKISILLVIALSLSLLSACGGDGSVETFGTPPNNSSANSVQASENIAEQESENETAFLLPEYDYADNKLKLTDLSTGEMKASYSFDSAQLPLLTDKTGQGIIAMLSSQQEADVQNTGGVTIISGDSSAETLFYWLFDQNLNLVDVYELTNETLVNGLWSSVIAIAPDGKSLVYAEGSSLYQYTFDTQKLSEITLTMSETIYFEAIGFSDSGNYLAFFGSKEQPYSSWCNLLDLNGGNPCCHQGGMAIVADAEAQTAAVDCRNLRETEEVSGTLLAKAASGGYSLNYQNPVRMGLCVRRLTPTEAERLQGYPDGWTEYGHDGKPISDTKRYQMLGNSVAVPCVAYIMQGICDAVGGGV